MTQSVAASSKGFLPLQEAESSPNPMSRSPSETSTASSGRSGLRGSAKQEGISLEERWPDVTPRGRRALEALYNMTPDEVFAIAVKAGIYTPDGQLMPNYREDGEPGVISANPPPLPR